MLNQFSSIDSKKVLWNFLEGPIIIICRGPIYFYTALKEDFKSWGGGGQDYMYLHPWIWGTWAFRSLQSTTRNELIVLEMLSLFINSTIVCASNSTSRALTLKFKHMINPSLNAHSSARKLVVFPMFPKKASIQAPESERWMPPPSVFSLNQHL